MTGGPCQATRHHTGEDDPNIPVLVDEIGSDVELSGLPVDHAVGRCATDGFRTCDLLQIGSNLVELVRRAHRLVRCVRDDPKPVGPRHHGPGAAFVPVVEIGEVRVNPAVLPRYLARKNAMTGQSEVRLLCTPIRLVFPTN